MARISSKKTSPAAKKVFLNGIVAPGLALSCTLLLSLSVLFLLPSRQELGVSSRSTGSEPVLAPQKLKAKERAAARLAVEQPTMLPQRADDFRTMPPGGESPASFKSSGREALEAILSGTEGREAQLSQLEELSAQQGAEHAALHEPLAHAYLVLGDKERALQEIESALSSGPEEASARLYEDASQLYFERGSYEEALAHIDQALSRQSEAGNTFFTLIKKLQILGALQRTDEIETVFQDLSVRAQPGQEKILIDLKHRYNS